VKILVRAPNWIGDQVMAYPFFHFLRKRYPTARIVSVCVPWVQDIQFRNLVDQVLVVQPPLAHERNLWSRFKSLERAAAQIRAEGPWDLGISLPNSFGAAWLLWRSGAKRRRGYALEGRGVLLNEPISWPRESRMQATAESGVTFMRHRTQAYADLLADDQGPAPDVRGFWGMAPENELDPWIEGELPAFPASLAWPKVQFLEPPSEPYWVLSPGATADSRRWPEDQFAALIGRVAAETGWTCVIVGGPKEAPIASRLADRMREDRRARVKDWTARGSVASLFRVFSGARFTVTNESGLAHVASLCGSPVQIVCGAADPRRTKPIGPGRVQVTINAVDCWPCEKNVCSQQASRYLQCLKGIRERDVWDEVSRGLLEPKFMAEAAR